MIQIKDKVGLLYNKTNKILSWRTQEELSEDWIYKLLKLMHTKTMPFRNHIPVLFLLDPSPKTSLIFAKERKNIIYLMKRIAPGSSF